MPSHRHHRGPQGEPTPGILFAIAAFALLIGGFFGYRAVGAFQDAGRIDEWKTTQGVITRSIVETEFFQGDATHRPDIAYRYAVDGVEYTGTRVGIGATISSDTRGPAARVTRRYPGGKEVVVTYDPNNPSSAVLETDFGWKDYAINLGVPAVAVAIALSLAVWGVRLMIKGKPAHPEPDEASTG